MRTTPGFLASVLTALQGLGEGDFDRVDVSTCLSEGPDEQAILAALRHLHSNLKNTSSQADVIARGNYTADIAPQSEKDLLGIALHGMTKTLRDVAKVAQSISAGDYSSIVQVKGENDELAKALNEMVANLRRVAATRDEEVWLKAGQAELADCMRGDLDLAALCKNIVTFLATYLGAQVGLLFLADEEGVLRPAGSYACPRRERLPIELHPGEGIVGEAAIQRRTMVLDDVPDTYLSISSGLGQAIPRHIVAVPFPLENRVCAVLELGLLKPLGSREVQFLDLVAEKIAIGISAVENRERLVELLEQTQRQTEELQAQSEELQSQQEELRAANEELEEQTQRLLASEESLRAQTEELQASNEELEESTQRLERQKAEIQSRNHELELARESLARQARDLARASKYKSQFLANMSHELRTPLNSLLILAGSLAQNDEGNLTPKQVESARVIQSSGKDLLDLINDILDLSKVEAGRLHLEVEDVSITVMAHRLGMQFSPLAKNKGLSLEVVIEPDLPESFRNDGQRVEQIVKNLLANACKFTSQGTVTLRFHRPDPHTQFRGQRLTPDRSLGISVLDTGIGIPEANREDIFEAFHQGDGSTSRRYGGTGLGLAISRELSLALGGEIHVQSTEGKGSTFTLYLPLVGDAPSSSQEAEQPPQSTSTSDHAAPAATADELLESLPDDRTAIQPGDKALLIIEDDLRFAQILMDMCRSRGYRCLVASRGNCGLTLATKYQPAAILLDLGLPDKDGLAVLDELKGNLTTRHIPVHVVSGLDQRGGCLRRGAVGYLAKPAGAEAINGALGKLEATLRAEVKEVLVVEDNDVQREALVKLIANKQIRITMASTGWEACKAVASHKFDCVILDLGLPDMPGLEILQYIGRLPAGERPPVIIYTARDITPAEHTEIRKYTDSVVIKGADSLERVIDEVSLFLHSVESTLSPVQRKAIQHLHNPDHAIQGKKVLLVDDDARNTFALSSVLEKAGLEVVIADDGQLALEKLDSEPGIELVVMDIMMPVMDGYEAIRAIRAQRRFRRLPIIAVTAKAMREDRAKSLQAGANDYLTKPVDVQKLLSLMRVWLSHEEPVTA